MLEVSLYGVVILRRFDPVWSLQVGQIPTQTQRSWLLREDSPNETQATSFKQNHQNGCHLGSWWHFQERLGPGRVSITSWKQMYRIAQPAPSPVCTGKLARGVLKESMPACIMLLHSHSKGSPLSHVCWVFQLRAPGKARDTCLQQKHTKTICQG